MTELKITRPGQPATPPPRMTAAAYNRAFLGKNTIRLYLAAAVILTAAALLTFGITLGLVLSAVVTLFVLALLEYLIHRFGFHNRLLYRHKLTARVWRFLHYTHHINPGDDDDSLGPPQYTIPVVLVVTLPLGWLVAGPAGAGIAVAVGMWLLLAYEYAHGFAHHVAEPASSYGRMLRRAHMLHHFHNEKGNFGVTSPVFDFVFGTYYGGPAEIERSPTVKNLWLHARKRSNAFLGRPKATRRNPEMPRQTAAL